MASIPNPRRLLILSPTSQSSDLIPPFLRSLTGSPVTDLPSSASTVTYAGYTTHPPLRIQNKYYTAEIPIWVDEIGLNLYAERSKDKQGEIDTSRRSPEAETKHNSNCSYDSSAWKTDFLSSEASAVRDVIGGIVICIADPGDCLRACAETGIEEEDAVAAVKDLVQDIAQVKRKIEEERGTAGDVAGVLVLAGRSPPPPPLGLSASAGCGAQNGGTEDVGSLGLDDQRFSMAWWEDQLSDLGVLDFEVVAWDRRQESMEKNQFGESQGIPRVREVLETHDWNAPRLDDNDDDNLEEQLLNLSEDSGFSLEVNELESEMLGLKMAIGNEEEEEGEEDTVEAMDKLMLRVQGIKDMSAELPESERKRFAARAIREIMKGI